LILLIFSVHLNFNSFVFPSNLVNDQLFEHLVHLFATECGTIRSGKGGIGWQGMASTLNALAQRSDEVKNTPAWILAGHKLVIDAVALRTIYLDIGYGSASKVFNFA
jgi:hypothetical protein